MAEADKQLVTGEGEAEAPPPKKKSKLKFIIILAAGVLLLGGGGFFAWKFLFSGPGGSAGVASEAENGERESAAPASAAGGHGTDGEAVDKDGKPLLPPLAPAPKMVVSLDPFMVNLADTNARRFLRVIVAVDAGTEAMQEALNSRMPRVRDSLILLFSSKNSGDLTSTQGKYRLRMEILRTINNVLGLSDVITQAYYMEFVVQ
jgi:flagellar FliL protein